MQRIDVREGETGLFGAFPVTWAYARGGRVIAFVGSDDCETAEDTKRYAGLLQSKLDKGGESADNSCGGWRSTSQWRMGHESNRKTRIERDDSVPRNERTKVNITTTKMILNFVVPFLKKRAEATDTKVDDVLVALLEQLSQNENVLALILELFDKKTPDTAGLSEEDSALFERSTDNLSALRAMIVGCDDCICSAAGGLTTES